MTSRWTFSFGQERGKDHNREINGLLIIHVEIKCMARTAQK
jgi:hypothetical protein